ncbi:MAG: MFS transporter [Desulfobulbaceae bacterium A2]|nr:MAG: MFS transporter [Desulfobulbaceae bacterium A2]
MTDEGLHSSGQPESPVPPPRHPAGHWRSYLELLRGNARYRRFWLAGVVSQLGDWFTHIGLFILLTELTGSGQAVSWYLIAKFLPTTVLGPAAGILADRLPRKALMVGCDLARAAVVLCFLLVREPSQVWWIYLVVLVQESLWTLYHPARQAALPNLCAPEEINTATALSGATWSVMLAMSAALGGMVAVRFGWRTAVVIDSLSFLASALLLAGLHLPHLRPAAVDAAASARPFWRRVTGMDDLLLGYAYVRAHRDISLILFVKSGWALAGGVLVMLTVFGEQVLTERGGGSGWLYSMRGLGAAVGPVLAWRLLGEDRQSMYRAIGLAFFLSAAAYLGFSAAPTLAWASLWVFWGHVGGSIQWVFSSALLQRLVDDRYRGRVFAVEMALLTLTLNLSTWATGVALDSGVAPRRVAAALALLFILPGLGWLWAQRQLDDSASAGADEP